MTAWLSNHVRSVLLAFVLLVLGGLVAALGLPVSLFPRVEFPRVVVSIDAGDRACDQTLALVTRPVEEALRAVPAVQHVRSTTSRGSVEISLTFAWGHNMAQALLQTEAALNSALPDLPSGTRFSVRRMDPTVFPVVGLSIVSSSQDPVRIRAFAQQQLRPILASIDGVAAVDVLGGALPEYEVTIDPARLQSLGISVDDISRAIGGTGSVNVVGKIEDRHRLFEVLVESRLESVEDIGAIVVKIAGVGGVGVIHLSDVAHIRIGTAPVFTRVTAQGRDAVLINIRQTPDADSVRLSNSVEYLINKNRNLIPPDIKISKFYDQSELIKSAAGSVRDSIIIGSLFSGIILYIFLRSARIMLITAVLLPSVLAVTCVVLSGLGASFNIMTLGAMAAAVGLIVDDIVVMIEHIIRRSIEWGESVDGNRRSIFKASAEMYRPLIGSSLSTIVIFLPLAFVNGVAGEFFKTLAVTMSISLSVSMLLCIFVVPVLARTWLKSDDIAAVVSTSGAMKRLRIVYLAISGVTRGRPLITVVVAASAILFVGGISAGQIGSGFMPRMDEGGFILDYKARPGAALVETDRLLRQVEVIIRGIPEVDNYSRRTGLQLGGGLTEADEGDFFIHLRHGHRRDVETVMREARERIQSEVPGLEVETAQLMEDLIGDLTAVPQPVEIKLFGNDPSALRLAAGRVASAISDLKGLVEVVDGLRVAGDTVAIRVDRTAAAIEGISSEDISRQLADLIGGQVAAAVQTSTAPVGVRVRAPLNQRDRVSTISDLRLHAADGHDLPLSRVASLSVAPGDHQINREDLQEFVDVTARLENRDLGSAMGDIKRVGARLALPAGVRLKYGGLYEQQDKAFKDLLQVILAGILCVSLLVLYLFERWVFVIGLIFVVALAAVFVLFGLWVTQVELNISSLMGLTMVVGIVTELGIFFFSELPIGERMSQRKLMDAGLARLRPIVMSASIAILALMPLALGLGEGAAMQKPLAIAIISGLIAGVPLILFVLPALILCMEGFVGLRKRI